jgi:uncharacterized membrane protein YoaK (UPF0700 family)
VLALTFSTGVVDAVGFLGLDRVFTGNMTGNVVILGMGLAGAEDLPVVGPVVALAGFMAGALVAGRALRGAPGGWGTRSSVLLLLVALLLAGCAVAAAGPADAAGGAVLGLTGALGAAMGLQAQTARHLAVKDVTTVVVTSTITGLAADSWLGGRVGQPWARRAGAVVLIGAGAAAGALLLRVDVAAGIALSAGLTAVVAVLGHRRRPRDRRAAGA